MGKCEGSQLTESLSYRENGVTMYKNSNELHKWIQAKEGGKLSPRKDC